MNKVDKLYEIAYRYDDLTDEVLLANGLTDRNINFLIIGNVLESSKDNKTYILNNVNSLLLHYKRMSKQTEGRVVNYETDLKYLNMILRYFPDNEEALLNKAYVSLKLGENKQAADCYFKYYLNKEEITKEDILNLHLLSKIVNVGDLSHEAAYVSIDDISSYDPDINKARSKILERKYEEAFNMLYNAEGNLQFNQLFTKTLLSRIISSYRNGRNYKECIFDERYDDALYSLLLKEDRTKYENLILKLLCDITDTKDDMIEDRYSTKGLWGAIYSGNYEEALDISVKYNQDKNIDDSKSPVSFLLRKLIAMYNTQDAESYDEYEDDEDYFYYEEDEMLKLFKKYVGEIK